MLRIRNNRLAKLRGIRSREDTVQWGDRETDGGSKLESERVKMSPVLVVECDDRRYMYYREYLWQSGRAIIFE